MTISRLMTDAVAEVPGGAHFTSCPPDYDRDEAFQKAYASAAADPDAWAAFDARYLQVDEAGYRAAVHEDGGAGERAVSAGSRSPGPRCARWRAPRPGAATAR